jgi:hypothetical protein
MFGHAAVTPGERQLLLRLQCRALRYFLDNQLPTGLVLDRQRNHGPRRFTGLCSTSATGMGCIALALASAPPYRLLAPSEAVTRVRSTVEVALERLPHDRGIMPHFLDACTGCVCGGDQLSTVDSAWLIAGALWAAEFLHNDGLRRRAADLFARVDWHYWTAPEEPGWQGLLRHGKGKDGRFLGCSWDRINGETVFMYVLAAGADEARALPATAWRSLRPFYGTVAGRRYNNADLGLFVFQYGLDLLDLGSRPMPGGVALDVEAALAAEANLRACRAASGAFATYRRFWGLSSGDGPAALPEEFAYRCYTPAGPIDGTAHLTAALASVVHVPGAVLENLGEAARERTLRPHGRYGLSNINLTQAWVARDMVGIDAGAAVLALDNYLMAERVRTVFHRVPCVQLGLHRLGIAAPSPAIAHRAS